LFDLLDKKTCRCFVLIFRCIDTNLRLQLSPDEEESLFKKYDLKHDGTICYREFCDVINRSELFEKSSLTFIRNLNLHF
jgi:Ca2+-binding EF-hand superfamily protein